MKIDFDSSIRDKYFFYHKEDAKVPVCPLVLAVTGHRNIDPQAIEFVRKQTEQWFLKVGRRWQKRQGFRHGETSCAPILVLDGMAIGSDTLVAETILKIKKEHPDLNFQLIATLPMPKEHYERDFTNDFDLSLFNKLCKKSDYVVELPLVPDNLQYMERHTDSFLSEDQRIAQYTQLGKILASNSMFLLALWDGDSGSNGTPKAGGTADVVRMKLNGVFSNNVLPVQLETVSGKLGIGVVEPNGVVFHIVTPRESHPIAGTQKTGDLYCRFPKEDDYRHPSERGISKGKKITYDQIFSSVNVSHPFDESVEMNKDALHHYKNWNKLKSSSQTWLLGDNPPQDSELQFMTEHYTMMDSLALLYQKKFFRYAGVYILVLLLFSLIFYLRCYCQPLIQWASCNNIFTCINFDYLDLIYYLVFAVLIILFLRVKAGAFYEKYHRYRALAEILRVQIFWHLAAIPEKSHDHYWGHQINNMNWLRITAKTLLFSIRDNNESHFEFVKEHWLEDQYKYFAGKTPVYKKTDQRLERYSLLFLLFALIWFTVRIFVKRLEVGGCFEPLLYNTGVQFLAMSGMFALCYVLWNRLKANNSLVKRYKKIAPIYSQVLYAFSAINQSEASQEEKDEDRKKLLRYMGEYALMENADWFLMTRKLELPK